MSELLNNSPERRFTGRLQPYEKHESHFGGEVSVIEAIPHDEAGDLIETTTPDIWYGHGAGYGQEDPTVQAIATMGQRAFGMRFSGGRRGERRYFVDQEDSVRAVAEDQLKRLLGGVSMIVPEYQMTEGASLLGVIAERGRGPINALAQSKSAGACTIAAFAHPEMFNSITYAFPGNLTGPQTGPVPLRIARDGIVRRLYPPKPEENFGAKNGPGFWRGLYEQVRIPGFRADAHALRYSNLALLLHTMRQKDNAPPVTLVAGLKDRIFPVERYLKSLVAATDIDTMIVLPGGHGFYKRGEMLRAAVEQFAAMDRLKQERAAAHARGETLPVAPLRERIILPPNIRPRRARRILRLADELDARTESAATLES